MGKRLFLACIALVVFIGYRSGWMTGTSSAEGDEDPGFAVAWTLTEDVTA